MKPGFLGLLVYFALKCHYEEDISRYRSLLFNWIYGFEVQITTFKPTNYVRIFPYVVLYWMVEYAVENATGGCKNS